jgi:hypothetical protein
MTTAPGARRGAQPASPKIAASVCAALTTRVTTASVPSGSSAAPAQAAPPAAVKASREAGGQVAAGHREPRAQAGPRSAHAHRPQTDHADPHRAALPKKGATLRPARGQRKTRTRICTRAETTSSTMTMRLSVDIGGMARRWPGSFPG